MQWEWVEKVQYQRDLGEFLEAPHSDGYGARIVLDNTAPRRTVALQAFNVPESEYSGLESNVMTMGASYTFDLIDGGTLTGIIETLAHDRIQGTRLRNVTVAVRLTA